MPWTPGAPGERKKSWPARGLTMLEFAPGFADPNDCEKGHVGLVLSGCLEIEFDGVIVSFEEGDGFAVDPGTRHRARNSGRIPVRVFIETQT